MFAGLLALVPWGLVTPFGVCAASSEGTWHQLGVPVRLGSPLLWDEVEQRLVVIGADAYARADSIEDAWQFREASGWSRIRLPQPPLSAQAMSQATILADPGHRRFLAAVPDPYPLETSRLWRLSFQGSPQWWAMDDAAVAPRGILLLDVRGESAWLVGAARADRTFELWTRSLADTGAWRLSRIVPENSDGFSHLVDRWVDGKPGELFELRAACTGGNPGCNYSVHRIALTGSEPWGFVAQAPANAWKAVPDTARDRMLVFGFPTGTGATPLWSLRPDDPEPFVMLGEVDRGISQAAFALSPSELWVHGVAGPEGGYRTLALPLADPAAVRPVRAPMWPLSPVASIRNVNGSPFFRDAARHRWLYLPARTVSAWWALPDTAWELVLQGDEATWRSRSIASESPPPGVANGIAWANDEAARTLYVLNGWNDGTPEDDPAAGLYALSYDEEKPRWRIVGVAGPSMALGNSPAMCFDPVARELVCFGGWTGDIEASLRSEVWTLPVDMPTDGWRVREAEGTPPHVLIQSSAVYDPLHDRFVFTSLDPPFGALELRPRLRWVRSDLGGCLISAAEGCVPVLHGTRGILDPIGQRALLLGGDNSWLLRWEASLSAVGLTDTLGPASVLSFLGPGGQSRAIAGYDEDRDALIVFGSGDLQGVGLYEFAFDRGAIATARLEAATTHVDRIEVRWTGTPGAAFQLWRHDPGGGWRSMEPLVASASGALAFEDRAIDAGLSYGYRLTSPESPYTPAAAPVWVTAGVTAPSLALAPPWPNPSRGSLNLAFTLASNAPAELDVFDLAGRRVWSRRWDAPGAGPHHVALAAGELPRSGLYFVRLRQAGRTATARVIVTR